MEKNLDSKGRWRNKIVAFRVSPEEAEQIDACVRLSGLSKQDYITKRLTDREIVVQGNPRVYKALRNQMAEIYEELKHLEKCSEENEELPSKLYADVLKRGIAIARIVEEIQIQEEKLGIEKTIIVGDINENPYETGCLGASGFHGIPVYKDTMKKYRVIMDESFKMFYNPMWNLLGDFSFPPGTYYYSGNEVENSFWNVYDQVMIRPCLRGQFVDDELKILCETKKRKLIDANNHPDKKISDHLPIVFEIMED